MSGFYIGVDGKARKVKGGYIGIDGKARKIKKGYIGVDGVAQLCWNEFSVDPVFANNSWEDVALACQINAVPDSWAVGDQKTMTIDGADYLIDIIGKNHDDYADGSGTAPLTFQLHSCYGTKSQMHNSSASTINWTNCNMRTVHLPTILTLMPTEVQRCIKEVNKPTGVGNKSTTIDVTTDKLFLLSESEVVGKITHSVSGEGTQYAYYAEGNSKIKKLNETETDWWLRSPTNNYGGIFCYIYEDGSNYNQQATYSNGVSFAFCF